MALSLLGVVKVYPCIVDGFSVVTAPVGYVWVSRKDSGFRTTLQAWSIPGSDTALSIRLERCAGS